MEKNGRMRWLETLDPGYFVMTMATGIISIAFQALEMPVLSDALYLGTLFSWCVLFSSIRGGFSAIPGRSGQTS